MNKRTKRLIKADREHVWHPFTQMREWEATDPLIIERAKGNYLYDTEGNRYLDGTSSLWVTVHGHRNNQIDRAIKAQIDRVSHSTLLGLGNVPSIELAEKLVAIAPGHDRKTGRLTRVFFSDDGSTAVEAALKISLQYRDQTTPNNKKKKFIAFTGAYHGDTFGSMSVGEIDVFVDRYRPLLFESFRAPYPYCYRCPVGDSYPDCKSGCLDEFEKVLKKHAGEITACIIEPLVQGAAGMVNSPPGFLKGVRRLTKKYDVHLIADEVATGFGRTGEMFACNVEGVVPDILCLAKGLTGGYLPLAATLVTERIYRAFLGKYDEYKAFFHGHTYTGNPLGCAAAIANLDIFERRGVIAKLGPKIDIFTTELKRLERLKNVGEARNRGLMAGIELVADKSTKARFAPAKRVGNRVCMEVRTDGIMVRPIGDTIIVMPPLSVTTAEIKRMVRAIGRAIERVTNT